MANQVIGCDIGGVVRNYQNSSPINKSVEILTELSKNYEINFISKCKDSYKESSEKWLKENGLDKFKRHYCLEYADKVQIAAQNNVSIMIDDKIQVLSKFNNNVLKIWFCDDLKKISGTKKHQPELFETLKLATSWDEVLEIINNLK